MTLKRRVWGVRKIYGVPKPKRRVPPKGWRRKIALAVFPGVRQRLRLANFYRNLDTLEKTKNILEEKIENKTLSLVFRVGSGDQEREFTASIDLGTLKIKALEAQITENHPSFHRYFTAKFGANAFTETMRDPAAYRQWARQRIKEKFPTKPPSRERRKQAEQALFG